MEWVFRAGGGVVGGLLRRGRGSEGNEIRGGTGKFHGLARERGGPLSSEYFRAVRTQTAMVTLEVRWDRRAFVIAVERA